MVRYHCHWDYYHVINICVDSIIISSYVPLFTSFVVSSHLTFHQINYHALITLQNLEKLLSYQIHKDEEQE